MPFPYVFKLGRKLGGALLICILVQNDQCSLLASKMFIKFAWRLAIDWYVAAFSWFDDLNNLHAAIGLLFPSCTHLIRSPWAACIRLPCC